MNQIERIFIWLRRIHRSYGFGIQSPTDYSFVRYVINEHWPYYAYDSLTDDDWLVQKLGRLYFRLANWRRPQQMLPDGYIKYWGAGCHSTRFTADIERVELARLDIEDVNLYELLLPKCNEQSVMVVENIYANWARWQDIVRDDRAGTTFDLYYCGIVFFDKNRYNNHYTINF